MGVIRFLLAISVLFHHAVGSIPLPLADKITAVQTFFIISGFYMSLILDEKYLKHPNGPALFLNNRFLRIYPCYFVVTALTVLLCLFSFTFLGTSIRLESYFRHYLSWKTLFIFLLIHVTIFGQDLIHFTTVGSDGNLIYSSNWHGDKIRIDTFLMLPQAWTLGVELTFYLLAPWLTRLRSKWLFLVIAGSLLFRLGMARIGLSLDPWVYRFFPFELALFVSGILSYRLYRRLKTKTLPQGLLQTVWYLSLITVVFFNWIPFEGKRWLFYFLFCFCIPFIFILKRDSVRDRQWGEFSYPVYISHYLILIPCMFIFNRMGWDFRFLGFVGLVLTVLFSWGLLHWVIYPIEKIRKKKLQTVP